MHNQSYGHRDILPISEKIVHITGLTVVRYLAVREGQTILHAV